MAQTLIFSTLSGKAVYSDSAELQAYLDLGTTRMAENAVFRILERKTQRCGGTQQRSDELLQSIMANTLAPQRKE